VQPSYLYKALVTNIVDGDTVDAEVDVGFRVKMKLRLRLSRINTYELTASDPKVRELALKGREYTYGAINNKEVVLQTYKADAFGRYLAEVFYEKDGVNHCLNDELLNNGLAKLYTRS
jgi:micrococcal nuclease